MTLAITEASTALATVTATNTVSKTAAAITTTTTAITTRKKMAKKCTAMSCVAKSYIPEFCLKNSIIFRQFVIPSTSSLRK